eukprot:217634-Prymnesium_polylepis.1
MMLMMFLMRTLCGTRYTRVSCGCLATREQESAGSRQPGERPAPGAADRSISSCSCSPLTHPCDLAPGRRHGGARQPSTAAPTTPAA